MLTCDSVNAIMAFMLGLLVFNIVLVFMVSTVRSEVQELLRRWKEVM